MASGQPSSQVSRGKSAEKLVEYLLLAKGWQLLRANYRFPGGEIDRIFIDPEANVLVFVEVKLRKSHSQFPVEMCLTPKQLMRIRKGMEYYIADNQYDGDCRLDFVSIEVVPEEIVITLHENWVFFTD